MPEQALYLKWRPMSFEDVVGQEHITRTLRNSLKSGRIRHAYLFSGPRGTGKTTSARLLAKAINCQNPDVDKRPCNECPSCIAMNEGRFLDLIEIDAASHTGVDDVRDLRDKIAFAPGEGRYKVYIIDEVHRFSGSAFDALLKTLEEPPEHAIFVLATTEIDKVPQTIKSRCLQFEFRRFTVHETADRLQKITDAEGLKADRPALEMIARYGTGSMRDSISLLDQIVTDPDEPITLALVENVLGTASSAAVKKLVQAMIERDAAEGLQVINAAIDSGTDPRQFGEQVVDHLRSVLITQTAGSDMIEASPDERALYDEQGSAFERARLVRTIRTFNEAIISSKGGWQPQLALELALIESLSEPETVVQVIQQTAVQPNQQAATPPPVKPKQDATPAIPSAAINEKWDKVLRALLRYSKTGPDVMKNFRVQRVEGSTVYLCTDNETFYKVIQPYPKKIEAIVLALGDVFHAKMTVAIVLVSPQEMEAVNNGMASVSAPVDMNDSLLSTGLELGAEIKRIDNP